MPCSKYRTAGHRCDMQPKCVDVRQLNLVYFNLHTSPWFRKPYMRFTRVLHKDNLQKRECTSAKKVDGCGVRTYDLVNAQIHALYRCAIASIVTTTRKIQYLKSILPSKLCHISRLHVFFRPIPSLYVEKI